MSVWRDATPAGGSRWAPSRYSLAGALLAALIVTGAAAAAIGLGGHSHRRTGATTRTSRSTTTSTPRSRSTTTSTPRSRSTTTSTSGAGKAVEIRDPEEARSHPAPASLRHSTASSPSRAAESIAPGAASNAQIREELAKIKELERNAANPARMATVPGGDSIAGSGKIAIPTDVPAVIQRVIAGANAITDFPYRYGGGHASFVDNAYDCSGSVSYALAAGGLLKAPETSGQLESWGAAGPGKWITVYANAGHTYMYVNIGGAWMLYDTAGRSGVLTSRWQPSAVDNEGYVVRHWPGL